ncbi:MAG: DUF892 family protein [bacterium]
MSDTKTDLRGYVSDMLAVETELHEALRRQKHDDGIKKIQRAHQVVSRTEDTIDKHLAGLRDCLTRLGAEESPLKKAVGGVMGAAAGLYDKLRSDGTVSRTLRDDYAAISFAIVSYEMLHTTALAMREPTVAELALKHLADFAPLIMTLSETLPHVLVEELLSGGKIAADTSVANSAARNTREAWEAASSHA